MRKPRGLSCRRHPSAMVAAERPFQGDRVSSSFTPHPSSLLRSDEDGVDDFVAFVILCGSAQDAQCHLVG
jgi:hypothetical protein